MNIINKRFIEKDREAISVLFCMDIDYFLRKIPRENQMTVALFVNNCQINCSTDRKSMV